MGRVCFNLLRNARFAVGRNQLGNDAPQTPRFYRNRQRPAFTRRRFIITRISAGFSKVEGQTQSEASMMRYTPDMMRDPVQRFMNKYYWMSSILLGVALFAFGGFSMIFWAIGLRVVFGWQTTWLVNSATHTWGTRRFESRDTSTNNGLIAALTFGEGWHNNHHTYPRSAKHGLTWKEIRSQLDADLDARKTRSGDGCLRLRLEDEETETEEHCKKPLK